jgi:glycosyltransferase involved in cell wall biosynthesis
MPRVSVIIPTYFSQGTLAECLTGLREQSFDDFEIVIVNSSPELETRDMVRGRFPEVRFEQSPIRLLPHEARNRAAGLASGDILVFTDPDCRMHREALARLVAAHDDGHPLVGGAIENAHGGAWERGVHFAKFAWWLPGGNARKRADLPTAIVSYSRALWEKVGPFDEGCWCADSMCVERFLRQQGVPWFEPGAIVYHHHVTDAPAFLRERYHRGADYGANRPQHRGWSRLRIAAQLALVPVLPTVMTARSVRYAASSGRLGDAVLTLPVILAGNIAWCGGEAVSHAKLLWRH